MTHSPDVPAYRCDFQSCIAIVNGKQQNASSYVHEKSNRIECYNGHELKFSKGVKVKSYFSHKHSEDLHGSEMTKWHTDWQSKFEITEQKFSKKQNQVRTRYADAVLSKTNTIEFQHSKIAKHEIDARMHDYSLHGVTITWVIHGATDVTLNNSIHGEYLVFKTSPWKVESFTSYDFVYVHVKDRICAFTPRDVGPSKMVSTKSFSINQFIQNMKEGVFYDTYLPKFNLTIKQQGAGNGKTYGLNKMMFDNSFEHYSNIIMVTKQHSAKTTIKETFLEVEEDLLNDGTLDYDCYERFEDECILNGKAYQLSFLINDNHRTITIATLDSLTYRLADHSTDSSNLQPIRGWSESINYDYLINNNDTRSVTYGGNSIRFNKETLLVLDEAQDLDTHYADTLLSIAKAYNCDLYVVGDLLQSISYADNAFVYYQNLTDMAINIIFDCPTNVCRRFKNLHLRDVVNSVVPFEKFNLPHIDLNEITSDDKTNLKFIQVPRTTNNPQSLSTWAEPILQEYMNEVEINGRTPNDFLIIIPIIRNGHADYLNNAINEYWSKKGKGYISSSRYCIFHKGQEGSSINLEESIEATRIVSIHSSKGDGRPVVVVCELSEPALLCFDDTKSLKYESLLHVALTRQKETLYITYTDDMINDDIGCRFHEHVDKKNDVKINLFSDIKYSTILSRMLTENNFKDIRDSILNHTPFRYATEETNNRKVIDMGHHHIRYGTMFMTFVIDAFNNLDVDETSLAIKDSIHLLRNKKWASDSGCRSTLKGFTTQLGDGNDKLSKLVHYTKGGTCKPISDAIYNTMRRVHSILIPQIVNAKSPDICVYEALVFYYMYHMFADNYGKRWKSPISITDLYMITETYYATFDNAMKGHNSCLCKTLFGSIDRSERGKTIYSLTKRMINREIIEEECKFLRNHYESIDSIRASYKQMINEHRNKKWTFFNQFINNVSQDGIDILNTINVEIDHCGIPFVGEDDESIILVYLKPTFGKLNYNDHLLQSIYNEYVFTHYLDVGSSKTFTHMVFSASGVNRYDFAYNRQLIENASTLIAKHLMTEIKRQFKMQISKLASIYNIVFNETVGASKSINLKTYRGLAINHLSGNKKHLEMQKMYHERLITSNILSTIYESIAPDLTPKVFKERLLLVADTLCN